MFLIIESRRVQSSKLFKQELPTFSKLKLNDCMITCSDNNVYIFKDFNHTAIEFIFNKNRTWSFAFASITLYKKYWSLSGIYFCESCVTI